MDKVNKQELRRLAEGASHGQWLHATEQGQIGSVECNGAVMVQVQQMKRGDNVQRNSNAAFIAAANPAAILSLLDELERLEANHNQLNHGVAVAATSEWNRLAEENDQLRAELEQYRKDAERYRWLYDQPGFHLWLGGVCRDEQISSVGPDTDIDALMAKEGGANG